MMYLEAHGQFNFMYGFGPCFFIVLVAVGTFSCGCEVPVKLDGSNGGRACGIVLHDAMEKETILPRRLHRFSAVFCRLLLVEATHWVRGRLLFAELIFLRVLMLWTKDLCAQMGPLAAF